MFAKVISAVLLGLTLTRFSFAAEVTSPRVRSLPNGVRVIVKSDHGLGLVAMNLVIRAGSRHEGEAESGVAHFLEHMLFRGSRSHLPGDVEASIEAMGGAASAGTLRDFTHVYAIVPSAAFEETLEALADAVFHPNLDRLEMERERRVILHEIAGYREGAREMLWDLAHQALFSDHPYGRPVNGTRDSILNMGREQLVAFHNRWYVPNNIAVVIVGDVSESEAIAAAEKAFNGLIRGPVNTARRKAYSPSPGSRQQVYYHRGPLAYVGLTVKAPGMSSPLAVCATDVLQALLAEGRTSLLQPLVRGIKAPAVMAGAEFLTSREPSPFLIWAGCTADKTQQVKEEIERQISTIAGGKITPDEIITAKRRLETAYWLANETYIDQADVLGFYEAIDSHRFATDYVSRIRAVTPADVKKAAQTYFAPERRVWLMLLPQSEDEVP